MSTIGLGEWGEIQVVVHDRDVTFFRGVPTRVLSWSSGDPFGDATAVLEFASITSYEVVGAADLFWLRPHANVEINIVRPGGAIDPIWEGMIASINDNVSGDSSVIQIECIGALYQLDYYTSAPKNLSYENMHLYEEAIKKEFEDRPALRTAPLLIEYPEGMDEEEGTGWKTRYSGGWDNVLTGYIQRLLADMVHGPGDTPSSGQWTLLKNPGRQPVLRLRDEETIHYTVLTGVPGVTHDLKADFSQTTNVIYGEGTDESGTTWRNAEIVVDTDYEPPEVSTVYHPVGWDETTHPADKSASESGEPTDPPPDIYNPNFVRIERSQQYGGGVSLFDARRSANQQIRREVSAGHFGTITLDIDPPEGSRFEIQAGQNILLQKYKGAGAPIGEIYDELLAEGIYLDDNRDDPITRGQYASILVRMLEYLNYTLPTGSTSFTDVDGTTHQDSIEKLEAAGILVGYGDGTFRPNDELSRGQLAGVMVRVVEWAEQTTLTSQNTYFFDTEGNVHEDDINKAAENYLIFGNPNGSYHPNRSATRRQAALVLHRINRFLGGDMLEDREGIVFHVSQVEVSFDNTSVMLTVDSKFRDLATLSELIERTKAANKNPAKLLMANRRSASVEDTKFPWDYNAGSGSIPTKAKTAMPVPPEENNGVGGRRTLPVMPPSGESFDDYFVHVPSGEWKIVPVVMAGKGTVQRSEIRAYDGSGNPLAIPFHVGVYGMYVTELSMPPDPFAPDAFAQPAESGNALSGYDSSAIILWGQEGQRAGYWPGLESEGNALTGVLIDEGAWQFQLLQPWEDPHPDEPVVWVAFYAEVEAYFQGRFYHGVQ